MELNFSFRAAKEDPKPEKYPNLPVLTFVGGNKTSKFQLNEKACEMLGYKDSITATINYAKINETDDLVLANTGGTIKENRSNLTLAKDFANSKFLDRLEKHFELNLTEGAEFLLAAPDYDFPYPVLIISNESPNSKTSDSFEEFPDDAFEVAPIIESEAEKAFNSQRETF